MPIPLKCSCGKALQVKEAFAGKKVRCPGCQTVLLVPAAQPKLDSLDIVEEPEPEILDALVADEPRSSGWKKGANPDFEVIEDEPSRPSRSAKDRPHQPDDERRKEARRLMDNAREEVRKKPRRREGVVAEEGWFGDLNAGVAGGFLMIVIAVVWFVAGLAGGIIFFYPPVLLIIGIVAVIKGLAGGE